MISKKKPPPVDVTHMAGLIERLTQHGGAVISAYEFGVLAFSSGASHDEAWSRKLFQSVVDQLTTIHLLSPLPKDSEQIGFVLFGREGATAGEIACSLDPFAYVSHLSAMEYHGLTDRFPKMLCLCRPPAMEWRRQAALRMQKDLGDRLPAYQKAGLPRLSRSPFSQIGSTAVKVLDRTHLGAFRHVAGSSLRVATLGRTFLDMLREPSWCGGIQHVLDVYRSNAARTLRLITDEVDRHGEPIDKIRVGYVLTELCGLSSPVIDGWVRHAQRGGSRKLDPDAEYASAFSDRWKLSLNVPSIGSIAEHD